MRILLIALAALFFTANAQVSPTELGYTEVACVELEELIGDFPELAQCYVSEEKIRLAVLDEAYAGLEGVTRTIDSAIVLGEEIDVGVMYETNNFIGAFYYGTIAITLSVP